MGVFGGCRGRLDVSCGELTIQYVSLGVSVWVAVMNIAVVVVVTAVAAFDGKLVA